MSSGTPRTRSRRGPAAAAGEPRPQVTRRRTRWCASRSRRRARRPCGGGLRVPGQVRGAHRECVVPLRHVDRARPLHPGVVAGHPAQLGLLPRLAVEPVPPPSRCRCAGPTRARRRAPTPPGTGRPAARPSTRDWVFTGPLRGPAALGPVGGEVGRTGSPRGRRATWSRRRNRRARARPSAPGTRARGQRPAVHRDGEHRVPAVGERLAAAYRSSTRPARSADRVGIGRAPRPPRAGRRSGRRSTRRCRSGRHRPGSRRSRSSPRPRSAGGPSRSS